MWYIDFQTVFPFPLPFFFLPFFFFFLLPPTRYLFYILLIFHFFLLRFIPFYLLTLFYFLVNLFQSISLWSRYLGDVFIYTKQY